MLKNLRENNEILQEIRRPLADAGIAERGCWTIANSFRLTIAAAATSRRFPRDFRSRCAGDVGSEHAVFGVSPSPRTGDPAVKVSTGISPRFAWRCSGLHWCRKGRPRGCRGHPSGAGPSGWQSRIDYVEKPPRCDYRPLRKNRAAVIRDRLEPPCLSAAEECRAENEHSHGSQSQ